MGLHRRALQPMFLRNKWKILRGDTVLITKGKDAGQTGLVTKVHRDNKQPSVTVKGMNLYKKHIKRTQDRPGGIVDIEKPLAYSNVSLIDPVTKASCRVSWRYLADGTKVRVTRGKLASESPISRPAVLARRSRIRTYVGKKDTPVSVVQAESYEPEYIPAGVHRIAKLLAGQTRSSAAGVESQSTSLMSSVQRPRRQPPFRSFAAQT